MMKRSRAGVVVGVRGAVLAACAGLACASGSVGANIIWVGGASGVYQTPTNWAGGDLPGFNDTIVMNTAPSMTVDFMDDVVIGRVLHTDGNLTLNLNSHILDLRVPGGGSPSWATGATGAGAGDIDIDGGGVICNWAALATGFGQTSTVILDDPAASFETRDSMRCGAFADGTFSARMGSSVLIGNDLVIGENPTGNGLFTLFDTGTVVDVVDQVQVGALGDGVLRVNSGSTLTCENLFISAFELSTGEMFVAGAGTSVSIVGGLSVGFEHDGLLEVNSGSTVSAFQLRVALNTMSSGILRVQGAGSQLLIGADAVVGSSGTGELLVRNGGYADLGELTISGSEDQAVVNVIGPAAMDVRDEVRIGLIGSGDMNITSGAVVTGDLVQIGGGGLLNLDGGVFNATTIDIMGLGPGSRAARGTSGLTGVIGSGSLGGDVTLSGSISPGPDFSTIAIDGGLTIESGGVLTLDFRAPAAGTTDSDSLTVTGDVVLGGLLRFEKDGATVNPPLLQSVPIITGAASVVGMFADAEVDQPIISPRRFIIVINGGDVEMVATVVGDVTGDAVVDSSDLAALLAAWGTSDHNSDFNNDGVVDAGDLATLLAAWG